jgi:hypothetical protein
VRHVLRVLTAFVPALALVGCGVARAPGGTVGAARTPTRSAQPQPTESITAFIWQAGSANPEARLPNPGTGAGDPRLLAALLPQAAGDRFDLPAAVVAMPDTDRRSLFIGLRQMGTPVAGPPECDGWYGGLWTAVVARFNVRGVQLAVTMLGAQPRARRSVSFSEAIITGPSAILRSLAGPVPPAACRVIAGAGADSGGIRPLTVPRTGLASWAYEVTGAGKFPVWQWVEVVRGPGFLLEVCIPIQEFAPKEYPDTLLPRFAAAAYRRALSMLS